MQKTSQFNNTFGLEIQKLKSRQSRKRIKIKMLIDKKDDEIQFLSNII